MPQLVRRNHLRVQSGDPQVPAQQSAQRVLIQAFALPAQEQGGVLLAQAGVQGLPQELLQLRDQRHEAFLLALAADVQTVGAQVHVVPVQPNFYHLGGDWRAMSSFDLKALPEFLTVEETAQILRLKRSTAYEYVRQGIIPSVRVGYFIRVPKAIILELAGLTTEEKLVD